MSDPHLPPSPFVRPEVLERFRDGGLGDEVNLALSSAEELVRSIDESSSFVSARSVLRVLAELPPDPADTVYVLSRNDRPGFWTQGRRTSYLEVLSSFAATYGRLNQIRVLVYAEDDAYKLMPADDVFFDLQALHAPGTLRSVGAETLVSDFPLLSQLRWGCTLSREHQYAIIPIPPLDEPAVVRDPVNDIPAILSRYPSYDASDGPMLAMICAHRSYVQSLLAEFAKLAVEAPSLSLA